MIGQGTEDVFGPLEQAPLPVLGLAGVNIELRGQLGQGLFTLHRHQGDFRFEGPGVIASLSSGPSSAPSPARILSLKIPLIRQQFLSNRLNPPLTSE